MEGTCNCGALKVIINDPDLFGDRRRGHICYCINCKKTAGAGASNNLIIEDDKFTIEGAENLTEYTDPNTLSGKSLGRFFCKTCGNPIKSVTPNYVGKTVLKLGIFHKIPHPEWESFAIGRQPWQKPLDGAIQYKTKAGGEKLEL